MSSKELTHTEKASHVTNAPLEPRSANRPPTSLIFPLVGWGLLAAGLAITVGPQYVSELAWYAKVITRQGFSGEVLCLAGLMFIGMGWIASYQRGFTRTLLQPGMAESLLEDLRSDVAATQDLIRNVGGTQVEQGVDLGYLKKALGEARNEARAADPKDAIFRLAASLDQLGARLDQRIGEATSVLQDANYELSSLVESNCEGLQDKMERTSRKLARHVMETLSSLSAPLEEEEGFTDAELELPEEESLRMVGDLEDEEEAPTLSEQRDLGLLNELEDADRTSALDHQPSLFKDPTGQPRRESAG